MAFIKAFVKATDGLDSTRERKFISHLNARGHDTSRSGRKPHKSNVGMCVYNNVMSVITEVVVGVAVVGGRGGRAVVHPSAVRFPAAPVICQVSWCNCLSQTQTLSGDLSSYSRYMF